MSSLFDDAMMGAKVANVLVRGAMRFGKFAADGLRAGKEQGCLPRQTGGKLLSSAKKYCVCCGAALDLDAKFCSRCGAAQEAPSPVPESTQALPMVLQNGQEEIPDIFGFQPGKPGTAKAAASRRDRAMEYIPGRKNTEPYAGKYHLDDAGFDLDMCIYEDKGKLCVSYYDHVDAGTHLYRFEDWGCGRNVLYGIAQEYSFKFVFHPDDRLELDTYGVFPDLSGMYRCME